MDSYPLKPISRVQSTSEKDQKFKETQPQKLFRIKNSSFIATNLTVQGQQLQEKPTIEESQKKNKFNNFDVKLHWKEWSEHLSKQISGIRATMRIPTENALKDCINNLYKQPSIKPQAKSVVDYFDKNFFKFEDYSPKMLHGMENVKNVLDEIRINSPEEGLLKIHSEFKMLDMFLQYLNQYKAMNLITNYDKISSFVSKDVKKLGTQQLLNSKFTQVICLQLSVLLQNQFDFVISEFKILQNEYQRLQKISQQQPLSNEINKEDLSKCSTINDIILLFKNQSEKIVSIGLESKDILSNVLERVQKNTLDENKNRYDSLVSSKELDQQKINQLETQLKEQQKIIDETNLKFEIVQKKCKDDINLLQKNHSQEIESMSTIIKDNFEAEIESRISGLRSQISEQQNIINSIEKQKDSIVNTELKSIQDKNSKEIIQLIDEMKEQEQIRSKSLREQAESIQQKYIDIKANNENLYQEFLNLKQMNSELIKEKEVIVYKFSQGIMTKQEFSETYEYALQQEFNRMKNSYESRIEKLNTDILNLKKEKQTISMKLTKQLEQEIETKNLLMRKLTLLSKI